MKRTRSSPRRWSIVTGSTSSAAVLVDPEDDMRVTNPATNPALLDALAADFIKSGFDLKHLVRTITTSSDLSIERAAQRMERRRQAEFLAILSQAIERGSAAGLD